MRWIFFGRGGQKSNSRNIYAPYIYISLALCLNQCLRLSENFLAPDAAEDASADAAADINNNCVYCFQFVEGTNGMAFILILLSFRIVTICHVKISTPDA